MKRLIAIGFVLSLSTAVVAQSIRIGAPANPQASDDVFVLRYFTLNDQQGYGTIPGAVVSAARQATPDLAAIAVVGLASGVPYGARDSAGVSLTTSEVTWNALSLLQIKPALGRDFTEADARAGKVAGIITHATWISRYGGRNDAIGSKFVRTHSRHGWRDDGEIVGVLPPGVFMANPELDPDTEILVLSPDLHNGPSTRENWYAPLIRPRPGVTVAQTETALDAALKKLQTEGGVHADHGLRLESLRNPRR